MRITSGIVAMYSSQSHQYASAKEQWIAPFDYQERHAGMKVRTTLTHALAELYQIEAAHTQVICHCVERFNTASLVHDDIVDQDQLRRGAPSVWVKFGVATALISGMYGYIEGLQKLGELHCVELLQIGLQSLEALHIGQHLDTQISEGTTLPTMDEYRFVAQINTGCFFLFILEACQRLKPVSDSCYLELKGMLLELAIYYRLVNDYCDINHTPHFKKKGFAPDLEGGPKSFLMILAGQPLEKKQRSELQKRKIINEWGKSGVFSQALTTMENSYTHVQQYFSRAQRHLDDESFISLREFLQNIHFQQNPQDNFYEWQLR